MPLCPSAHKEVDLVVLPTLNRNASIASIASLTVQSMKKMNRIEWSSTSLVEIDHLRLLEVRDSPGGFLDLLIASGAQVAALGVEIMIGIVAGLIVGVLEEIQGETEIATEMIDDDDYEYVMDNGIILIR